MTSADDPDKPPSQHTPDASCTQRSENQTNLQVDTKEQDRSLDPVKCTAQTSQPNGHPSIPSPESQAAKKTPDETQQATSPESPSDPQSLKHRRISSTVDNQGHSPTASRGGISEWSHQQLAPHEDDEVQEKEVEWETMPAFAPFDIYDDDGKLVAKEAPEEEDAAPGYGAIGGATKGYTRVQDDEDAQSQTSMDENTAYLFKEPTNNLADEDEDARDALAQMQMTKELLSDNQRIAYVGIVKLATAEMAKEIAALEKTRGSKKQVDLATEALLLWGQKMMVRLYGHMELESAEQVMIEQLAEHGLETKDLTPALMNSSTVKNPAMATSSTESLGDVNVSKTSVDDNEGSASKEGAARMKEDVSSTRRGQSGETTEPDPAPPPPYQQTDEDDHVPQLQNASELAKKENLEIDLRWTVLCDLFLILISDSNYDARSRTLLERVASYLDVTWIDVCRFEKRVTEALEMEEEAQRDEMNENDNMEKRRKRARNRRLAMMGLATVGGGLVIGLSAGLLAPVIGAGLAAGFTTIGVTGTSGFLAGAGGAAVIGSVGTVTGSTIGVRAANRRTGAVKTFEYRPLHNNKRVNLIVTVAGWMNGKVDDVRLPFSTVDPIMGDIYSILWEPEMLRSMGDTINILATEALTQGLQQILGSTILIALMAALQLPIVLSKLSYLIDNPWSVSVARADAAGLILADSLIERNLGARPITLVGFSLGSRVIFSCLKELASKGALGLIQNVYLFGTPVVAKKDEYLRARTVVAGRFVNGYATNDWILGYLFRATGGGIMRVAGLAKVEIPGIENFDVTEHVPGHMAYRNRMPLLLRKVDWAVTSDEFSEIEDPDPDNHEKRQRELINEIEEARKELEEKPEKRKFGIFSRNKKRAQKKNWETYDESIKQGDDERVGDVHGNPLFDVEAIMRETVELAAEGVEIRQLETTMPPMKIDSSALSPPMESSENSSRALTPVTPGLAQSSTANAKPAIPAVSTVGFGSPPVSSSSQPNGAVHSTKPQTERSSYFGEDDTKSPSDQLYFEQDDVTMTFESSRDRAPSLPPKPMAGPSRSPSPQFPSNWQNDRGRFGSSPSLAAPRESPTTSSVSLPQARPYHPSRSPSPPRAHDLPYREANGHATSRKDPASSENRPVTAANTNPNANPWADEDDEIGKEKELSMTFE